MAHNLRRDLGFYGGHGSRHVRRAGYFVPQSRSKELTGNRDWLSNVRAAPAPVMHVLQQPPNSLKFTVF